MLNSDTSPLFPTQQVGDEPPGFVYNPMTSASRDDQVHWWLEKQQELRQQQQQFVVDDVFSDDCQLSGATNDDDGGYADHDDDAPHDENDDDADDDEPKTPEEFAVESPAFVYVMLCVAFAIVAGRIAVVTILHMRTGTMSWRL